MNFTTQVLQSIGLGLGEPTEGLMDRPPRKADEQVMPLLGIRLAIYGAIQALSTLVVIQVVSMNTGDDKLARTMGLATFSFANLFYGLSCNDLTASVFSRSLLSNATLLRLSGISLLAIILANQLDLLNRLLLTVRCPRAVGRAAAGLVILWVMEVVKFFQRRRPGPAPRRRWWRRPRRRLPRPDQQVDDERGRGCPVDGLQASDRAPLHGTGGEWGRAWHVVDAHASSCGSARRVVPPREESSLRMELRTTSSMPHSRVFQPPALAQRRVALCRPGRPHSSSVARRCSRADRQLGGRIGVVQPA